MSCNLLYLFLVVGFCFQNVIASIKVNFDESVIYVQEDDIVAVNYTIEAVNNTQSEQLLGNYQFIVQNTRKAKLENGHHFVIKPEDINDDHIYCGQILIKGVFLGYTNLQIKKTDLNGINDEDIEVTFKIGVTRGEKTATNAFTAIVSGLLVLAYYKMGTTLDLKIILEVLRKPISPCIGLMTQCVLLPLSSYAIGWLLFDEVYYRLGLFIFGCSPGGGSSNLWTMLIGGNLNLSITMTFISTFISMISMPVWLYTLGRLIFDGTEANPHMMSVLSSVALMTVALLIGYFVKKYLPSANKIIEKFLKWIFYLLGLIVAVLGLYANLYVFRLFTYKTVLACFLNVLIGSGFGFILGTLFRRPVMDSITIAIEVGVQNMGITLAILRLSLGAPDADLASSIPFIAAFITPFFLLGLHIYFRIRKKYFGAEYITEYDFTIDKTESEKISARISIISDMNLKFDNDNQLTQVKSTNDDKFQ